MAEDGKRFVDPAFCRDQPGCTCAEETIPAFFALALAVADKRREVSSYALSKLPVVARIPTYLFHFAEYVQSLRGWGRELALGALPIGICSKPAEKLAYQLAKYQSRDGRGHNADLLCLSHANLELQVDHKELLHWAVKGWSWKKTLNPRLSCLFGVFEKAKRLTSQAGVKELVRLIAEYESLPRECVPTEFLLQVEVWDALSRRCP